MAKTKISQFDATASNNTDINSVNVAEGCPPSGINNAIREMASLLKKQEVGTDAMTSPDIDGGTIDGATIGGSSGVTIGVSDGTVSAPSIKFTGDTNTGIYRGGTDILKFVTAGTDAITIDASQNVGIGTGSPNGNGILTINAPTDNSPQIVFSENNTAKWLVGHRHDGDHFRFYDLANSSEAMRIEASSGNLLVGHTSQYSPIGDGGSGVTLGANGQIFSGCDFTNLYINAEDSNNEHIRFRKDGADVGSIGAEASQLYIVTGDTGLKFASGVDAIIPVNANGANRDSAIDIGVSSVRFKDLYLSNSVRLDGATRDFSIQQDNFGLRVYDNDASSERFRITAGGNVGIGNSSPSQKLDVNGTIVASTTSGQGARIERNGTTGGANFDSVLASGSLHFRTGGTERTRIVDTGFFKTGNLGGTYRSATGTFHEMITDKFGDGVATFSMTNASYAGGGFQVVAARSNFTGMSLFEGYSGNGADREFRVDGAGQTFADGAFSSTGGDYAEMFEWKDGNTSSEDRVGKTVVLDGNQIRLSTSDDAQAIIIGVVSARPVILGDAQSERWVGKYETDDFGRYIREEYTQTEWTEEDEDGNKSLKSYQTDLIPSDVTVPSDAIVTSTEVDGVTPLTRRKLNSSYDSSQTYIPREQRKEFSPIGLVGKLKVRVGQTVGDRWIKMREISDTVHEYLVR